MQPVILMSLTAQILKYDNCSMVPDDPEGSTAPTAAAAAASSSGHLNIFKRAMRP
jgi:hypothetical protein